MSKFETHYWKDSQITRPEAGEHLEHIAEQDVINEQVTTPGVSCTRIGKHHFDELSGGKQKRPSFKAIRFGY